MNEEIDNLLTSLRFEYGYALGIAAWVTVLRLVFIWFSNHLKEFAEQNVAEAGAIQRLFDSRIYRITAFLVNALTSLKLPTTGRKMVDLSKPTGILPLP